MKRKGYQNLRSAFLAGVLLGVPAAITIWVFITLVLFLEGAVKLLPKAIQPENLLGFPIPGLGILLALSTILLLGLATRSYVGSRAILLYERLLARVPVLSSIYQGIKQLMEAVFASGKGHFQQVVLVEYPRRGVYALAFLTGDAFLQGADGTRMVNVFLPTTPNPTSGFYLVLPKEDMVELDISVEQAFKLIMSAGIVAPPRRLLTDAGEVVDVEPTPMLVNEAGGEDESGSASS
ncbi:MAG: DUF502 domain-containing protein [Deltaproteobacteria bacterium]|nr:DUF502 domain-containing protein [Deltaproteobacteria bacterium]